MTDTGKVYRFSQNLDVHGNRACFVHILVCTEDNFTIVLKFIFFEYNRLPVQGELLLMLIQ